MATYHQSTPAPSELPERIPRFVRHLSLFAERAGFRTSFSVEPYTNDPELRLWSVWEGTVANLLSLGWLTPSQVMLLARPRQRLTVPSAGGPHPLATGELTVSGGHVSWSVDSGPLGYSIADVGAVEVVRYDDWVLHHGSADTLIAAGVDRKHLPTGGKRTSVSGCPPDWYLGTEPCWHCRRQPDGLFLYRVQSAASLRQIRERAQGRGWIEPEAKGSHLRLVVDNTRP